MSAKEWQEYEKALEESKDDYFLYGPNNLRLTMSHIIKQYDLDTSSSAYWVFQHWQAFPKPKMPYADEREFGYFIQSKGSLTYKTIPAELIVIEEGVKIIPLQYRGCYIPSRIPTAGNYFPNSSLVARDGRYCITLGGI